MDFILTHHAARQMADRKIRRQWISSVIEVPERREPDRKDPTIELFYGRISSAESKVLLVVVNTAADPWRIVSVFFDRRMRGRL
ncbi:MAG: DUF4258 domain-containing protein [Chloroflexi bacterium]|nr:DUF4258 domain-containing protein [Chloroflexota bacterium]